VTLFEYLAAGYVLMLSFAVLRAISGLPHAIRPRSRYWVHVSWLLTSLALCLVSFWAFWSYRQVEWTIFRFMNALAIPALLYAYTSLLVPPDPATVSSWRSHYFEVRTPLFVIAVVFVATVILSNQSTLGVPPLHPSQLSNYVFTALVLTGLLSARPRVHGLLAVALPLVLAVYFLWLLTEPDSAFRPVR
jgi:hypothetical protein